MKKDLILGEDPEKKGYTIYKNIDEKLVAKIKAISVSRENFNIWKGNFHKNSHITQTLNEIQYLCIDEDNEYFIVTEKDIQDALKQNLLEKINKEFDLIKIINNSLAPLYDVNGLIELKFIKRDLGVRDFDNLGYTEIGYNLYSAEHQISVHEKNGSSSSFTFAFINKDGNIVNRDYNLNLSLYLDNKRKTRQEVADEIIKNIPDISYENYGDKWFTDKFAYTLIVKENIKYEGIVLFKLKKVEKVTTDRYGDRDEKIYKPKKGLVTVGKDHILSKILPLVNEMNIPGELIDLSLYTKCEDVTPEPKLRVQETVLNELDYEVYDYRDDDDILSDTELMEYLYNIKNSIDIPKNEEKVKKILDEFLSEEDLPSFSFNKGEKQPDNYGYKGLVKLPHDCNFTFKVEEGDACEITWDHSIYYTDIIELELVN